MKKHALNSKLMTSHAINSKRLVVQKRDERSFDFTNRRKNETINSGGGGGNKKLFA